MKLTVFETKFACGWPDHAEGAPSYQVEIGRALRRDYTTDAHCVGYVSSLLRRINTGAVGRVDVAMPYVITDADCDLVHGTSEPVPPEWRSAELEKVHALNAEHPGVFAYDSRGGYRLFYALPEPAELVDATDVDAWSRFYRIWLVYLERRFGIVGDPACGDFTRLFRMPRATRDRKAGPERRAAFGDPDGIGALTFEPSNEDVEKADASMRPTRTRTLEFTGSVATGDGLLFYLLQARGDMGDECRTSRGHGRICRCPNRARHTNNSDGTKSTIWYPPAVGKEIGAIHCKHAHCVDLGPKDWIRFFTDSEKDAARERAGIATRKQRAA